jgi:hypothetical protein
LLWKSAAGIAHSQALDSGEKPPGALPADKPQEFETRPPLGANSRLPRNTTFKLDCGLRRASQSLLRQRISQDLYPYGLLAKCVVLENESGPCFDDLVAQHTERFAPADGVEVGMIEEMAAAYWRMRRAWAIENRLMEKALRNQPPGDEAARIAAAFSELAASPELNLLHRYEVRLHRMYQRALYYLALLGECELPNEPSPISEHQVLQLPSGVDGARATL